MTGILIIIIEIFMNLIKNTLLILTLLVEFLTLSSTLIFFDSLLLRIFLLQVNSCYLMPRVITQNEP